MQTDTLANIGRFVLLQSITVLLMLGAAALLGGESYGTIALGGALSLVAILTIAGITGGVLSPTRGWMLLSALCLLANLLVVVVTGLWVGAMSNWEAVLFFAGYLSFIPAAFGHALFFARTP